MLDEDNDPRPAAFQQAWKSGASLQELFSNGIHKLHGIVGPSGADNYRPDVAKVQTLLARTGHLRLPEWGPLGYYNAETHDAIGQFQQENQLAVDGMIKPDGPTITTLANQVAADEEGDEDGLKPGWKIPPWPLPNPPILVPTPDGSPPPPPKQPIYGPWPPPKNYPPYNGGGKRG